MSGPKKSSFELERERRERENNRRRGTMRNQLKSALSALTTGVRVVPRMANSSGVAAYLPTIGELAEVQATLDGISADDARRCGGPALNDVRNQLRRLAQEAQEIQSRWKPTAASLNQSISSLNKLLRSNSDDFRKMNTLYREISNGSTQCASMASAYAKIMRSARSLGAESESLADDIAARAEAERIQEEKVRRQRQFESQLKRAQTLIGGCPDAAWLDKQGRCGRFAEQAQQFGRFIAAGRLDDALRLADTFCSDYVDFAAELNRLQAAYTAAREAAETAIAGFDAVLAENVPADVQAWCGDKAAVADALNVLDAGRRALKARNPEGVGESVSKALAAYIDLAKTATDNVNKDERRKEIAEAIVDALVAANYNTPDVGYVDPPTGQEPSDMDDISIYAVAPGSDLRARFAISLDGSEVDMQFGREDGQGNLIEVTEADGVACHSQIVALQANLKSAGVKMTVTDWGKAREASGVYVSRSSEGGKTVMIEGEGSGR